MNGVRQSWLVAERETVTRTIETPAAARPAAPKSTTSFMAPGAALGSSAAATAGGTETRSEEVVTRAEIAMGRSTRIEVLPGEVTVQHGGESLRATMSDGKVVPETEPLPRIERLPTTARSAT